MFNSFKSTELLRYYLSNTIKDNYRYFEKKSDDETVQIISALISTEYSLITTFITTHFMEDWNLFQFGWIVLVAGISFILTYILCKSLLKAIRCFKIKRKHYKSDIDAKKAKQIVDDYDHIACDNILVALEFMKTTSAVDENRRTFYYYEILYYLDSALERVENVVSHKDKCIKTSKNSSGVDAYRIDNLRNLMNDIINFLFTNISTLKVEDSTKNNLRKKIEKDNDRIAQVANSIASILQQDNATYI